MKKFIIGLCVVCMIFSLGIVAFAWNYCEEEPNDTHYDAKHGVGYLFGDDKWLGFYGLVSSEDNVDWIKVTTRSRNHEYGDCNITLKMRGNYDIDLYMYDENEKLITSSTNVANEDEEIVGYFMQPNKEYYFKIVYLSGDMPKEPNYELKVRLN